MTQNDWKLLVTLFEEKNITKSAAKLFITQPAVTKRLKILETEFDVKIVNRTPKGVIFTEEGIILAKYSKKMLKEIAKVQEELSLISKSRENTIKIAIPNGLARKHLARILSAFKEIHPGVDFEIVTGWSTNLINKIENDEVDVAFVRGERKSSKKSDFLFSENFYVVNSTEISIQDLPYLTRVEFESDLQVDTVLEKWWKNHFDTQPKKTIKVDRADVCGKMVKEGLGYAFLPGLIFSPEDKFFKFPILDEKGKAIGRETRLYYSDKFAELNIGKEYIQFIKSIDFSSF